jgi:hypothetical protein
MHLLSQGDCCFSSAGIAAAVLLLLLRRWVRLWLPSMLMHVIMTSSAATQATLKAIQKQTGLKELSLRDVPMDSFQVG